MDTANGMIVTGTSVAWCGLVEQGKGTAFKVNNLAGHPAAKKMFFDSLTEASYKLLLPSEQTSDTKIETTLANGAKIQHKKYEPIINGDTGAVESGSTTSADVVKGEITLVTSSADKDSASWSAFINKIKDNIGKYWLVCVPVGYTSGQLGGVTPNADGFVMLIGKLSTDLDFKVAANAVQTLSLAFKSESVAAYSTIGSTTQMTDAEADTFFATDANFLLPDIEDVALGVDVNPPDIGSADGHILVKGGVVVLEA